MNKFKSQMKTVGKYLQHIEKTELISIIAKKLLQNSIKRQKGKKGANDKRHFREEITNRQ